MEIVAISPKSIRIKSKASTIIINPQDKSANYNAAIIFDENRSSLKLSADKVVFDGPGEYEIGGIKISGTRYDGHIAFEFIVDEVRVLLVDSLTLVKHHQKLSDIDIAIVNINSEDDPTIATNVANAAVLYYGLHAENAAKKYTKEGVMKQNKFTTTKDKLASEVQQVLLV